MIFFFEQKQIDSLMFALDIVIQLFSKAKQTFAA